jgi:hypothetical protein
MIDAYANPRSAARSILPTAAAALPAQRALICRDFPHSGAAVDGGKQYRRRVNRSFAARPRGTDPNRKPFRPSRRCGDGNPCSWTRACSFCLSIRRHGLGLGRRHSIDHRRGRLIGDALRSVTFDDDDLQTRRALLGSGPFLHRAQSEKLAGFDGIHDRDTIFALISHTSERHRRAEAEPFQGELALLERNSAAPAARPCIAGVRALRMSRGGREVILLLKQILARLTALVSISKLVRSSRWKTGGPRPGRQRLAQRVSGGSTAASARPPFHWGRRRRSQIELCRNDCRIDHG